MKRNCWEFQGCGREKGGSRAKELGVCPAAEETRLDGVHQGRNAGRSCWMVPGTLCDAVVDRPRQSAGMGTCTECDFYRLVREEEKEGFVFSGILLAERYLKP